MKAARLAVPAAALLLLTACSTPSGATAWTVDGSATSNAVVEDTTAACAGGSAVEKVRPQVAQFLFYGQLAHAIAERNGFTITPAMRAAGLAQFPAETIGQMKNDPQCAPAADGISDFAAVAMKVGEGKLRQQVEALDVEVNPRYGSFDPAQALLTGSSGSLSREALPAGVPLGR